MKSIFYFVLLLIITGGFTAYSQDIQNSGFESWSTKYYFSDPDQYTTSNYMGYLANAAPNVTKNPDAHSGSYAATLETVITPEGPLYGAVFIGDPNLESFVGGIPYTSRPDSVTGYAKFNIQSGDTAYFAAVFKLAGAPLGYCIKTFYGTQEDYIYFSVPVQWLLPFIPPDSLLTGFLSSSFFSTPVPGSTITVDDISFVGVSEEYPNGGFENWTDYQSEEPDDWTTSNLFSLSTGNVSVTKSDDSYEGNYAVRIENQPVIGGDTLGFVTNGLVGEAGPAGGMPVENIPDKLSGYYKYFPQGQDTALAGLTLYHYDQSSGQSSLLDEVFIKLPPASNYTYFEVPVDYYSLPECDTVNIAFGSGNFDSGNPIFVGSTLYVDALEITYKPNLVAVQETSRAEKVKIWPNPVKNKLFADIVKMAGKEKTILITNANGELVKTWHPAMNASVVEFNTGDLPAGLYFFNIQIGHNKNYSGKFIVE